MPTDNLDYIDPTDINLLNETDTSDTHNRSWLLGSAWQEHAELVFD